MSTEELTNAPAPNAPRKRTPHWRLLLGWLLVLLNVPVAIIGAWFALVGVCYLTGWHFAQEAIPLISLFALVATGTWLGLGIARHSRRWRPSIAAILGVVATAGMGALCTSLFAPLASPVEMAAIAKPSRKVRYWDLPTGSRIAYLSVPARDPNKAAPILFLHGGPGIAVYDDFLVNGTAPEAPGRDCYYYDQVGCGFSSRLADVRQYTVDRHVADLEAIRQQIGADQIVLSGASWGASLAANYLAAHPEHVARVVLSAPGEMEATDFAVDGSPPKQERTTEGERQAAAKVKATAGTAAGRPPSTLPDSILLAVEGQDHIHMSGELEFMMTLDFLDGELDHFGSAAERKPVEARGRPVPQPDGTVKLKQAGTSLHILVTATRR